MEKQFKITHRQREILQFIFDFLKKHGYSPTLLEITDHFQINVKTAYEFISRLESNGFIEKEKNRSRTISLTEIGFEEMKKKRIPIVGSVAAGQPVFSEVNIDGDIVIDAQRFPKNNYFALKVSGVSMIEAGIHEGDYIIVDPDIAVHSSDIVVVMVDGEVTTKRIFYKQGKQTVILHPENKEMEDILVPAQDVRVIGKVVGVQRFYE